MRHFINLASHIFPQCVSGLPINGIEPSLPPQVGACLSTTLSRHKSNDFDNPDRLQLLLGMCCTFT